MAKILLVDDDQELAEQLKEWLGHENHIVEVVNTGEDGLQMLANFQFDLILLDWSLPGISGVDVCKQFRGKGGKTSIIFLTGKGDIDNKEEAFESGGDDYLVKPFNVRELSARVRSLLRRPTDMLITSLKIKDELELEPQNRVAIVHGSRIHLMPKECALLEYLIRHPNLTFGAGQLLEAVWPSDSTASKETVRTTMKTLRQKLAAAGKGDLVKTVLGSGYIIEL